jgi:hypothetical protein
MSCSNRYAIAPDRRSNAGKAAAAELAANWHRSGI